MVNSDWHAEDVKAALRKQFGSLRAFEIKFGLDANTVAAALRRPYAAPEAAISSALGVAANVLWPSRYHADGRRKQPQPKSNYRYARGKRKHEATQ